LTILEFENTIRSQFREWLQQDELTEKKVWKNVIY
jgi:hypothetical protein